VLACWVAGVLACWVAGLLACWIAGELDCLVSGISLHERNLFYEERISILIIVMKNFRTLVNIDDTLRAFIREIEKYFSIQIDGVVLEKIFEDSKNDHVSAKEYLLFLEGKKLMRKQLTIRGTVDEHEPATIWI
jgi:hypothetical protein